MRCAEAVLQGTTHGTARREIGYGERVSRRLSLKRLQEKICLAESQRDTERAEARRVFALETVVSCSSVDRRWRTKLDFGSSEPFDDLHRPTAFRAAPKFGSVFGAGSLVFGSRFLHRAEQVKAKRQECGTFAIGEETEVADAHETLGEQVQQEAAQELVDR